MLLCYCLALTAWRSLLSGALDIFAAERAPQRPSTGQHVHTRTWLPRPCRRARPWPLARRPRGSPRAPWPGTRPPTRRSCWATRPEAEGRRRTRGSPLPPPSAPPPRPLGPRQRPPGRPSAARPGRARAGGSPAPWATPPARGSSKEQGRTVARMARLWPGERALAHGEWPRMAGAPRAAAARQSCPSSSQSCCCTAEAPPSRRWPTGSPGGAAPMPGEQAWAPAGAAAQRAGGGAAYCCALRAERLLESGEVGAEGGVVARLGRMGLQHGERKQQEDRSCQRKQRSYMYKLNLRGSAEETGLRTSRLWTVSTQVQPRCRGLPHLSAEHGWHPHTRQSRASTLRSRSAAHTSLRNKMDERPERTRLSCARGAAARPSRARARASTWAPRPSRCGRRAPAA